MNRICALLLNLGHALDHLFLLIFATAVAAIARDFGLARWEDLMPYTAGAFVMFGLGSIPAGRLGDLWGRRRMMLVFYVGMGLSSLAVALTQTPGQMAVALTVLGLFSAIYHPVGIPLPKHLARRTVVVMIGSAIASSLLFNFTTNGNAQLLAERLDGLVHEPAVLGLLLAVVYAIASFAQVVVGRLLDRVAIKPLLFGILCGQAVIFGLAAHTSGWVWYGAAIVYMISVFAAIPFNDLMVVRYIDDSMRSRVSGFRIAVSFGISSMAVYMLGPLVKQQGFTTLMMALSVIAALGACIVIGLPGEEQMRVARQP